MAFNASRTVAPRSMRAAPPSTGTTKASVRSDGASFSVSWAGRAAADDVEADFEAGFRATLRFACLALLSVTGGGAARGGAAPGTALSGALGDVVKRLAERLAQFASIMTQTAGSRHLQQRFQRIR